jgi:CDP-diacylglycerol--glycerol-3-phosphate 3-phosphatidyltransferase
MFSQIIGKICKSILDLIVAGAAALRISPNILTFAGFLVTMVSAVYLARGRFFQAGLIIIVAGIFDMLDGRVARTTNNVTQFGAFFDSVLDRYSDIAMFLGRIVYYSKGQRLAYVVLSGIACGCGMTSYTRAAPVSIPLCKVVHGASRENGSDDPWNAHRSDGSDSLGHGRLFQSDGGSQNCIYLERNLEVEAPCLLPLEPPHPHCVLFFPCRPPRV